ncbi:MAG: phosphate/phosphite/phosphonate ABC transporter substrate-binding protein [Rhodospirillaceae bacterium]|jgi:phosphonate transport system substrate-binding protein|nr:phosphate/phosphite/phosphonate ABC transporter substrate-binding protein [Rhodospirillaceae bacterium]MBT5457692.1 phosphate/phosphite/phosphonate ABC transporter substrate-binding protein [Rhodospirillaceae bacterium]
MKLGIISTAFAVMLMVLTACDGNEADSPLTPVLRIGVLPDQKPEVLLQRYAPLFEYLSARLEIPYVLVPAKSYDEYLKQFIDGRIDLAYFGGLTYLKARRSAGADPLVMRDVDANFTSYYLVRTDSDATDLADLKGKKFSFGSRLSTSGHLMPRHFLTKRGMEPEAFFGEIRYSGAHDKTAYHIRDGHADVGVANAQIINSMLADGRISGKDIRVLGKTPPFPDYIWVTHRSMSRTVRQKILDAFLDLSAADKRHAQILGKLTAGMFIPAREKDFALLKAAAMRIGLLDTKP